MAAVCRTGSFHDSETTICKITLKNNLDKIIDDVFTGIRVFFRSADGRPEATAGSFAAEIYGSRDISGLAQGHSGVSGNMP